ncbi:MAG: phosphoglycerate dehydrogenase, partial [Pseudomonadota bacterium]
DGLAIRSATKVTSDIIERAENLKVVGRAGIGVDNVDSPAATAAGVAVMNTPFGNSITTAEHAIAMMFALARQLPQADQSTQAGKWEKSRFMGQELYGKTLGLIGCGNIGAIVADRAQGLKMKVIAYDPFLTEERAMALGVEAMDLDSLLGRADIISLHTPLNDKTRNILSKTALAKTKQGVRIINCARGGLIDEEALLEALDNGHVAGAALDVFAQEPATENPLFGHENIICTPHLGAATAEAQEKVAVQIAEQIADYLLLGAVSNALNMPSVTAEEAPRLKPFIHLAEQLGALAGQAAESGLTAIDVHYAGTVSDLNIGPLTAALVAGVLRPGLSDVNLVNAKTIADKRGIVVTEAMTATSPNYDATIRVTLTSNKGEMTFVGALFGGEPRIVRIGDIRLEANFTPHMIFVRNIDEPGLIGNLGHLLSGADINIATFHLGRSEEKGEAIALVATDEPIGDRLAEKIRG